MCVRARPSCACVVRAGIVRARAPARLHAKVELHSLLMLLVGDVDFKTAFALEFTRQFAVLSCQFTDGVGTQGDSIFNLSVQFLNSMPSPGVGGPLDLLTKLGCSP